MKVRILLLAALWTLLTIGSGRAVTNEPVRVFMPDGQIKSHLLRVYITEDLTEADNPTLTLLAGKFLIERLPSWAERTNSYRELARFQHWTENVEGQEISRTGTLLVFDLRRADFPFFKACMRITPVIKWGSPVQTAVGDRPVYLGNTVGAVLWTAVFVGAVVLAILIFTRRREDDATVRKASFKWLLRNPEGRLSLSKTQTAVWTLCIGATVFAFGLLRLEPPAIPETLVALMGLSLVTRAVTYTQEIKGKTRETKDQEKKPSGGTTYSPRLSDLIQSKVDGEYELSISKAQMLFWTCVVACLFVVKSLLDGVLWDVPWQLVTLMGISQGGYMVPVLKEPPSKGSTAQRKENEQQSLTPPSAPAPGTSAENPAKAPAK